MSTELHLEERHRLDEITDLGHNAFAHNMIERGLPVCDGNLPPFPGCRLVYGELTSAVKLAKRW